MKEIQRFSLPWKARIGLSLTLALSLSLFGQCTTPKDDSLSSLLLLALLLQKENNPNPVCPTSTLTYSSSSSSSGNPQTPGSAIQGIDGSIPDTGIAEIEKGQMSAEPDRTDYAADEILVKLRPGRQFSRIMNEKGMEHFRSLVRSHGSAGDPEGRWVRIRLTDTNGPGKSARARRKRVRNAMAEISASNDISAVQPNYIYKMSATQPTDYYYTQNYQWALNNSSGPDLNILSVWNGGTGVTSCSGASPATSAVVAVVDTGVNYNHQDLSTQMWSPSSCVDVSGTTIPAGCPNHGWDFVDDSTGANDGTAGPDNDPMDRNGHGGHVAAIIGAKTETSSSGISTGMAGVCWTARIMAVRVLDSTGMGYSTSIANGIDFAVKNGAKVINASFGGYGYDTVIYEALVRARNAGVIVAAAAGNFGTNNDVLPIYPASYDLDNIISVASFGQSGAFSGFSNCGTSSVDIASPGASIWSAYPKNITSSFASGWLHTGTSPATPWPSATYLGKSGFADPSGMGTPYGNGWDTTGYFTVTPASSFQVGFLSFQAFYSLSSGDKLQVVANPDASVTKGLSLTGSSGGTITSHYAEIPLNQSTFSGSNYSVGFNLNTDSSGTAEGAFIVNNFTITQLSFAADSYVYLSGTSMATPHVTGLAALLAQYVLDHSLASATCDYHSIINAIEGGAYSDPAFLNVVHNGRRVDAQGALNRLVSLCP